MVAWTPPSAPQAKAFNDGLHAEFNTPPSTYSPEAYDAANALHHGDQGRCELAAPSTRQSVVDAVNKLDYKGITTEIKFQPNGEVEAQASINLYQQKNGKIGLVGDINLGQLTDRT